jgi:hypothetical protein
MNGIDENTIVVQIKSLMVYEFLNEYNKLEYLIREIFERNIHSLPTNVIQQLYFFYGGRIGSYIDTEGETVRLTSVKYKENDVFKELTVNQIIKIFKKNPCLDAFNFEIQSIQRAGVTFTFFDCVIRIINMRNILAHEIVNIFFKDKDLIELLSLDQLELQKFEMLRNYDICKMDNMTRYIASNIVYMRRMMIQLNSLK